MDNQCKDCSCNVNGICVVAFMPVDRALSYLGECECRTRNRKFKQEFPKIIGFAGYARAGKDTCADFVKEMFPKVYSRSAFANRLKYECSLMLSMVSDDFPNLFDDEDKVKYRDFLVFWGRYRRKMQPDYWIEHLEDENHNKVNSMTIISDVRYLNEIDWINKNGGIVIYVSRPNVGPANEEEENSFGKILRTYRFQHFLLNNGGLEDLKEKVIKLISEIIYAEKVHKDIPGNS